MVLLDYGSGVRELSGRDCIRPRNNDCREDLNVMPLKGYSILLSAQYLLEKDKTVADSKSSEMKDRSDWIVNKLVFSQIVNDFRSLNLSCLL